jgi:hypothetical protein
MWIVERCVVIGKYIKSWARKLYFQTTLPVSYVPDTEGRVNPRSLLRLKENLEARGYFVVYFAVDDQDIEPEDVEYADILMACTRHLVEAVVGTA